MFVRCSHRWSRRLAGLNQLRQSCLASWCAFGVRYCRLVGCVYPIVEGPPDLRVCRASPPPLSLSGDEEGSSATAASCGLQNHCKQSGGFDAVMLCLEIAFCRVSRGAAWIWDAFFVRLAGRCSLSVLLPCLRIGVVKQGAEGALMIECSKKEQVENDRCCGGADRSGVEEFADRRRWEFWTSIRSAIKSARQETTRLPLIVTSSVSDASALTTLLSRRRGGRCWGGGGDGVRTPRGSTRLALCRRENHHASGATTKAARRASIVSGLLTGRHKDGDAGASRPLLQFVRWPCTCAAHANMRLRLHTPISVMRWSVILVKCSSDIGTECTGVSLRNKL